MIISSSLHGYYQDKVDVSVHANQRQLLAFGFSFSIFWGVHNGLGHHESDIPADRQVQLRKSEYAFSVLYVRLSRINSR